MSPRHFLARLCKEEAEEFYTLQPANKSDRMCHLVVLPKQAFVLLTGNVSLCCHAAACMLDVTTDLSVPVWLHVAQASARDCRLRLNCVQDSAAEQRSKCTCIQPAVAWQASLPGAG